MSRNWYDPPANSKADLIDRLFWELRLIQGKPADLPTRRDYLAAAEAGYFLIPTRLDWLVPVRYELWREAHASVDTTQSEALAYRMVATQLLHLATTDLTALGYRELVAKEALRLGRVWFPDQHQSAEPIREIRGFLLYAGEIATILRDAGMRGAEVMIGRLEDIELDYQADTPAARVASLLIRQTV